MAALVMVASAAPGLAETSLSLELDLGADSSVTSVAYKCDTLGDVQVQYINADANSLALIPIDGEQLIFVNVISGSGARYVSGVYEWWSKGDGARLTNQTDEANAQDCTS
ncbi:MliC family protein [Chachezhania antarctica]|uniref:MliC family protein n=1 Tax=Chachezhania antarctica TaxID=2340860 RepID=UPI0013CE663B|nr:MliC family protein [Chachezhania antarctica]